GDPVAGGWRLFALRTDDNAHKWLSDYPKLGVWPDGIYMSANMFLCGNNSCSIATFEGARVWALNRDDLYGSSTLRAVLFDAGSAYFTLLPSNYRGAAPPAGTANYFVAHDPTLLALDVFAFHVDWTTPANSNLSGPVQVSEASYSNPPSTI